VSRSLNIRSARLELPEQPLERRIRVMLVDDSLVVRSILERILTGDGHFEICASVASAAAALDFLRRDRVDIIILDIEMPGMSGMEALPHIMALSSETRVLILSSNCEEGGPAAVEALGLGACDAMPKPGRGSFAGQFGIKLIERLLTLGQGRHVAPQTRRQITEVNRAAVAPVQLPAESIRCIGVAASTGGIPAFATLLTHLDDRVTAPILLTQHLPDAFIPFYAQQLRGMTRRQVHVAAAGMRVERGAVYLAPGEAHLSLMSVGRHAEIMLDDRPVANGCCPSADRMFSAIAEVYGSRTVAILLSGMGRDGADGAARMKTRGGTVLAQAPESCVVWGMPGAVVRDGTAAAVMNPDALAILVNQTAHRRSGAGS
jgi:two-component system chemotaxis response regulator CheB